jgi:hypothetical protein
MYRRETECDDLGWINVARDRDWLQTLVKEVMDLWVPYSVGNLPTDLKDCVPWN